MSGWGLLWELTKAIIPMIVLGLIALKATNGRSCDMPKRQPYQTFEEQREQREFFKRLDKR